MSRRLAKALAGPLFAPLLLGSVAACDPGTTAVVAGVSMVSFVHTDKTLGDHVATWAFDKDCSLLSASNGEGYCNDFVDEEELAAAEAEAQAKLAATYCYRTLGAIDCYRGPDAMASGGQRVR